MQDNNIKKAAAILGIMDIKNEIDYHKENRMKEGMVDITRLRNNRRRQDT